MHPPIHPSIHPTVIITAVLRAKATKLLSLLRSNTVIITAVLRAKATKLVSLLLFVAPASMAGSDDDDAPTVMPGVRAKVKKKAQKRKVAPASEEVEEEDDTAGGGATTGPAEKKVKVRPAAARGIVYGKTSNISLQSSCIPPV